MNLNLTSLVCALAAATTCVPARAFAQAEGPPSADSSNQAEPVPPAELNAAAATDTDASERYSLHFQTTIATQFHPAFSAAYSGDNSFGSARETASALVASLYADVGLWPGAELLVDPEISGGKGLSATRGIAGFPSGIVYRVGDPAPAIYLARVVLRQSIGLGGGKVRQEAGPNQLAGTRDRDNLVLSVGRLSVQDVFDSNRFAHDALEHFFDWALFASGAWDYPADTRGYTYGLLADLSIDWWSARAGFALVPKEANGPELDFRVLKAHGLMAEYEARYDLAGRPGRASALVFLNHAPMGSYRQVLGAPDRFGNDVIATRKDGRTKAGFALSVDQQLGAHLGVFLRVSANDGATESWAFTEIDRSLALGAVHAGTPWHREHDECGVALVLDALSPAHARYLERGGYGFIIGDGALDYAPELIGEVYYKAALTDAIAFTLIYQPVINPGYNRDRGPAHIFTGRLHVAI